ncbi:hypothetical protein SLEP1_g14343 [Rubroshorea leprosula]|uniref:Uncharacterized protein n=1 Tax=Rubroshorea leprosula TaxID=152421 RepID=A0AAV5IIP9_9ROSI|nr:hypothetical protein SLEP1_g14343 [Rubroshorea leprosula]
MITDYRLLTPPSRSLQMLAHVDMYTDRTCSFCNPVNGIIHWLLLKLTPASGSC